MGAHQLRRYRKRSAAIPVALVTLALSFHIANPYAFAGSPSGASCKDREGATVHFKRGNQLYEQKKLEGALAAFRDSRLLCPSENNTLNIALLLKDLDRPVDALDMLDILEHDFPSLQPENAESVKELRDKLEQLVGSVVFDGDYPDARILIDGKDAGTMPQARPLKLRAGTHTVRIEMTGHQSLDTSVFVLPRKNVQVAVALAVLPSSPQESNTKPDESHALRSFYVGASLSVTPGMGGDVSDCDFGCSTPPGVGALIVGGYRYQLMPSLRIGATGGYLFLWQSRSKGGSRPKIEGNSRFADVKDDLFLNALFAGPEVSTSFDIRDEPLDFGFSVGPIIGPLVNARAAKNGRASVDGPTTFDFAPPTSTSATGFGGIFLLMQASWRTRWSLAPGWPLHLSMGVLAFVPMNVPDSGASFTAHFRDHQLADTQANFDDNLLSSWSFVFTPGITVHHDL